MASAQGRDLAPIFGDLRQSPKPSEIKLPLGIEQTSKIMRIQFRGCQIGMQGPQLCVKLHHFCKLDVATSRMTFLDLNLHGLQLAISILNN